MNKPYKVTVEGSGALAKWKVYGPIKEVERGYFMEQQYAQARADELNAVHAYAVKLALEIAHAS